MLPIDLALIVGIASVSYYFIEQPIIRFARNHDAAMENECTTIDCLVSK
jgi:peptidoglycan/LPS O-acetylase OafA/YrhL